MIAWFWITVVYAVATIFGAAVLLSLSWIAHVHYPLNRVHAVLHRNDTAPKVLLYALMAYPVLSFIFVPIVFSEMEVAAPLLFCYGHLLLSIVGVECAYQFRKINKWNTVWLVLNIITGGLYVIAILIAYILDKA